MVRDVLHDASSVRKVKYWFHMGHKSCPTRSDFCVCPVPASCSPPCADFLAVYTTFGTTHHTGIHFSRLGQT